MDVTAVLTSSATLGFVAEAFGVLESIHTAPPAALSTHPASAEQAAWSAALDSGVRDRASPSGALPASLTQPPVPFIGPQPSSGQVRTPVDELPQLRGVPLLQQLGMLDKAALLDALAQHPDLLTSLRATPPAAADVTSWWAHSSLASHRTLRSVVPQLIGGLEGIPYDVRDAANRVYVTQTIARIEARLDAGVGRAKSEKLQSTLHMLEQVRDAIATPSDGATRQLVSIDISGEGRAVIAVGDLDTADYVSVLIPGMFYGVDSRIVPWTGIADELAMQQREWLDRENAGETTAVVSWIGYETPTLVNVASMENARQGRDALTLTLQGLDATREFSRPYVSILAHSYGATAALLALQENDVTVDALAMVGSAGSPARSVDELKVRGGRVWVGAAAWDPIPDSGVFGSQPTSVEYGAKVMGVDGGVDPMTGDTLSGAVSHNDYFAEGSEAMRNLALIGIDEGDQVMGVDGSMPALAAGK